MIHTGANCTVRIKYRPAPSPILAGVLWHKIKFGKLVASGKSGARQKES
jgi:hypothetical protein